MPLPRSAYTETAIIRERDEALEWMQGSSDGAGYPRSWETEEARDARNGYIMEDDPEFAPTVMGYERLAEEGLAVLVGPVKGAYGEARLHYRLVTPPPPASS